MKKNQNKKEKQKKDKKVNFNFNTNPDIKKKHNEGKKQIPDFSKSNVIVAVRCRPLNTKELEVSNIEIIKVESNKIVKVVDPVEYNGPEDIFKNRSKEQVYSFDYVFDKNSSQEDVYNFTTKSFMKGIIDGYSLTVFAYGISGAGKTFTMLGSHEFPGLIPRCLTDLFEIIESFKDNNFKIKITYLEIYNENLRDLISENEEPIDIREDAQGGVQILGAKEIFVNNSTEVFRLIIKGNKRRTVDHTAQNENSSRSHAILQICVERHNSSSNNDNFLLGKFVLIDLAGSEKNGAATSKFDKTQKLEGGNINKSLLALGTVINCLVEVERGSKNTFIPWRDSKLTRILKDTLGGNSRIVMIANISPSILCFEDTINTLKYANRAKNIKISIKKQIYEHGSTKYDEMINSMKNEIEELKNQLSLKDQVQVTGANRSVEVFRPQNKRVDDLMKEINRHFQEEIQLKKEIFEILNKIDKLKLSIYEVEDEKANSGDKNTGKGTSNIHQEIEKQTAILNQKYSHQSELMKKRDQIHKKINEVHKESIGNSLNLQYQYFTIMLNNMDLEHKKISNQIHMKIRDSQISKLFMQIKYRDEFLLNLSNELKKRNTKLKQNDNIKSLDDLSVEPISIALPQIIVDSHIDNRQKENIKKPVNVRKLVLPKINLNREITPHRMFNYELYKNPLQAIVPEKKFRTKTSEIIHHLKSMSNFNSDRNNHGPSKPLKFHQNYEKLNMSTDSAKDLSRFEKEIQEKTKTILRKNIYLRYKNSPYIKSQERQMSPHAHHR